MKDVTFNTFRLYTAEGQVVRAVSNSDGSISFHDFSRMVAGKFEPFLPVSDHTTDYQFMREVMDRYDRGSFSNTWIFDLSIPQERGEKVVSFKC